MGVFVLVDNKSEDKALHGQIPSHLLSSIEAPRNTLPFVVVANSDGSKAIKGFAADKHNSDTVKKLAREVKKKLREDPSLLQGDAPAVDSSVSSGASNESPGLLVESRAWTNVQGKTVQAAVVSVDDLNVIFLLANGKKTTYPIENLSTQSQDLLKEMTE